MTLDMEVLMLTDEELRRIFKFVYARGIGPLFLPYFAGAFLMAEDVNDLRVLRQTALMLVAKYNLGCFLCEEAPGMEKSA